MYTFSLNDEEIARAADLLAKLEPGYLPQRLFDEINRLHVASTVVVVPLKRAPDGPQVLLWQRGDGPADPVWPRYWHLPGTMLRPDDKPGDYTDAFERVLIGELGGVASPDGLRFVRTAFTETRRGRELTQLFYTELTSDPVNGKLFSVSDLPKPIIEHEVAYINEAAELLQRG